MPLCCIHPKFIPITYKISHHERLIFELNCNTCCCFDQPTGLTLLRASCHSLSHDDLIDPFSAEVLGADRADCICLLAVRDVVHFVYLCLLACVSQTDQPDHILCIVGKHSLQCCNVDVPVWYQSGAGFASVPIPGLFDPDVGHVELMF